MRGRGGRERGKRQTALARSTAIDCSPVCTAATAAQGREGRRKG